MNLLGCFIFSVWTLFFFIWQHWCWVKYLLSLLNQAIVGCFRMTLGCKGIIMYEIVALMNFLISYPAVKPPNNNKKHNPPLPPTTHSLQMTSEWTQHLSTCWVFYCLEWDLWQMIRCTIRHICVHSFFFF